MSTVTAPLRQLTVSEWYERYHDYEGGRCELVRGRAVMTPTEAFRNIGAAKRLARLLDDAFLPAWESYLNGSVLLRDDPTPTIRVPDLLLARGDIDQTRWLARAEEVALVAEVVSPSSMETDWVTKGAEYAAAGIPNYLLIDARFPDGPRLWLFDRFVRADGSGEPTTYDEASGPTTYDEASGRTTNPRYADPTGDGLSVTLRIPGADPITITATDLA